MASRILHYLYDVYALRDAQRGTAVYRMDLNGELQQEGLHSRDDNSLQGAATWYLAVLLHYSCRRYWN